MKTQVKRMKDKIRKKYLQIIYPIKRPASRIHKELSKLNSKKKKKKIENLPKTKTKKKKKKIENVPKTKTDISLKRM